MQLDKMTAKHYQYLLKQFGMDADTFRKACAENGDVIDALLEKLIVKECDAADEYEKNGKYSEDGLCAVELVDIICGPYDPVEINGETEN